MSPLLSAKADTAQQEALVLGAQLVGIVGAGRPRLAPTQHRLE